MSAAPLLECQDVSVRIPRRTLCAGLELSLHGGDCLAVLGRNGAGKSTLLHVLAGLQEPAQGSVCIDGLPYAVQGMSAAARFRGLMLQSEPDHFASTVRETVLVGRHPHLGRWTWEGAAEAEMARAALADVGLEDFAERNILGLSGGERQRVAIAALLVQAPRVFLLDEPLSHLDLHHQLQVIELFRARAAAGAAVVMVVHDLNLAARFANRVLLLDGQGGHLLGDADAVMQPEPLSAAFGHRLERVDVAGRTVFLPE